MVDVNEKSEAMLAQRVKEWSLQLNTLNLFWRKYKQKILLILLLTMTIYAWLNPYQFANWWLTKDQQGQILFALKKYDLASQRYTDSRWQAFSFYGSEQYKQAATLYSQFDTEGDLLAQANAYAHNKSYVKARALYRDIIQRYPEYQPAKHNLAIVEAIIDNINLMSESQRPEEGDSPKKLGDEPQRADGAEKKEARKQEIEQLSAEQLLSNPELNEMWLRQVQKNPAKFLGAKFQSEFQKSNSSEQGGNDDK